METEQEKLRFGQLCDSLCDLLGSHDNGQIAAFTLTTLGLTLRQLHDKNLIEVDELLNKVAPTALRKEWLPVWCKAFELLVVAAGGHPTPSDLKLQATGKKD